MNFKKSSGLFLASVCILPVLLSGSCVFADTQSSLQAAQNQYQQTVNKITALNNQSQSLQTQMAQINSEINARRPILEAQARDAQVNSSQTSIFLNILSSRSLSDALTKLLNEGTLLSAGQKQLEQQQADQKKLAQGLSEIETQQNQVTSLENQLSSQITSLKAQLASEQAAAARAAAAAALAEAQAAQAALQAQQAAAAKAAATTVKTTTSSSNSPKTVTVVTVTPPAPSGTINLSQTSGYVSPASLANYMSQNVGGSAATWYQIIMNESGGNVAAQNPTSTAYGVFQELTCPRGATLGTQISIAASLYRGQGFWGAWLRWE